MQRPSEAELEILQVLWKEGPQSVREVHQKLAESRGVGFTTILKQIQRMHEKGLLSRSESKPFQYRAEISEEKVRSSLFNRLVDTAFRGSALELAQHALGELDASPEEIEQLKAWLDQQVDKS